MTRSDEPTDRAVARYTPLGRFATGFARGKMMSDPAYASILSRLKPGTVLLDAGCGEGYLLALIAEHVDGAVCHGFDIDPRRLKQAEVALGSDATLYKGDAMSAPLPSCDAIAVLDVLHYQDAACQDAILARFANALRPGGVLLIRDGRSDAGWKSALTRCSERLAMALGRHRGVGVYFRPMADTLNTLTDLGLVASATPCADNTPFSNVLFVATKPQFPPPK